MTEKKVCLLILQELASGRDYDVLSGGDCMGQVYICIHSRGSQFHNIWIGHDGNIQWKMWEPIVNLGNPDAIEIAREVLDKYFGAINV